MATLNNFKRLAASGHLNKLMSEGVADAIARSRALGLPVEGYLNSDQAPTKTAPKVRARASKKPSQGASAPKRATA
jgi:hypothetical protein